jgi:uncharacterized damage-inducible protein DinB
MSSTPPVENHSPFWAGDTRTAPSTTGDERETLIGFLEWHRETFALKCADVPRDRLSELTVSPSTMSLHGLLRHLTAVERWWFRIQFTGEDVPILHYSDDDPDQDFDRLDGDVDEAFAAWHAECARSQEITAAASLDDTGIAKRTGATFTLRWLLVTFIAEYARHNGHADLLRERIDGRTGM